MAHMTVVRKKCSDGSRAIKDYNREMVCSNQNVEILTRSYFSLNVYPIKIVYFGVGGYYIQSEAGASASGLNVSNIPIVSGKRYDP